MTVGSYLGLRSIIGDTVEIQTVRAITPITAVTMSRHDLLYFVDGAFVALCSYSYGPI